MHQLLTQYFIIYEMIMISIDFSTFPFLNIKYQLVCNCSFCQFSFYYCKHQGWSLFIFGSHMGLPLFKYPYFYFYISSLFLILALITSSVLVPWSDQLTPPPLSYTAAASFHETWLSNGFLCFLIATSFHDNMRIH